MNGHHEGISTSSASSASAAAAVSAAVRAASCACSSAAWSSTGPGNQQSVKEALFLGSRIPDHPHVGKRP